MADNYALSCLVRFMDHLWFHHVILYPVCSELLYSTGNDSQTPLISSAITNMGDQLDKKGSDHKQTTTCTTKPEQKPARLNVSASKTPSHSSSPSSVKHSKNLRFSDTGRRLHRTMSCKSSCELELEEVKGFVDLGFTFNKERLSKRMMSVIPGLQRLELSKCIEENHDITRDDDETGKDGEKKQRSIVRPYLSEAWLIKRPDSPLLNLRIPRVSTAADMKRHLKCWAKTVVSTVELEG